MSRHRPTMHLLLALLAIGAVGAAPAPAIPPPPLHPDETSYSSALLGVWNYQSCGANADARAWRELGSELDAIESLARSKGLGPTLDRVRDALNRMLAVSTMAACGGGPVAALAGARRGLGVFRAWVEQTPVHVLTQAEIDAETQQDVLAADTAFAAAMLHDDETAIRRILDDHFELGWVDGDRIDADGLITALKQMHLIEYRVDEQQVSHHGASWTVNGTLQFAFPFDTRLTETRVHYDATYERQGGVWRLMLLHLPRLRRL